MLQHWRRPSYWRWWWQTQASHRTKAMLVVGGAALGGFAGYALAAGAFTSAQAAGRVEVTTLYHVELDPVTVDKIVTTGGAERTVRKVVPVLRTVTGAPSTLIVTKTSSPIVSIHTVTAAATFRPPKQLAAVGTTVVETRIVPKTETATVAHERVVTERRTVTKPQTVQRTVTQAAAAVTRTMTETETTFVSQPTTQTTTRTVVQTTPVTTTIGQTTTRNVTVTTTVAQTTTRNVTTTTTQTVSVTTTVPLTSTVTRTTTVSQTVTQTVPVTVIVTTTVPGK